jgi:3',5'-cyclic AMP phosphodiesterase CpdA
MSAFYSRRHFLRQLLGVGTIAAGGIDSLLSQNNPVAVPAFRFAFVTDLHLMEDAFYHSDAGIAQCLGAVEALHPRPDFILVGGDLVNSSRDLSLDDADRRLTTFRQIWKDHTSLPSHWTFGNHDLAGTSNLSTSPSDPRYEKGLFKRQFHLSRLFYSFDHKGWHFVVLDDIALQSDRGYIGQIFDDELAYLRADLAAHASMPTIVCTHIPVISNLALGLFLSQPRHPHGLASLVCSNATALTSDFPGHNIRAVLCGHLHHYEKIDLNGISYINSGAVCGNYWKGPMMGCPEGFGVVDVGTDGSFNFDYRTYGWQATAKPNV